MASARGPVSGAASGALLGAKLGSIVPGIGNLIGAGLGGLLGGLGGISNRELPKGVMSGRDARKLLGQGLSVDEILSLGPVGTFHPGKSIKQFEKMGVSPEDAFRLLASSGVSSGKLARKFPELAAAQGGMGGMGQIGQGPQGMAAFQALLPAIMGNQAAFTNPAAAQWLQSLFPQAQVPSPAPTPFPPSSPLPLPFEGPSTGNRGTAKTGSRGPLPDPFVGLRGLAGPFGNGGGPLLPFSGLRPGTANRFR